MSNEIFDKDKENELIGKQKKHLNKKISILSGIIVLAVVICFFGTYFSKAKPFNVASDKLTYYDFSGITMKIDDKLYNSLYDYSKLDIRNIHYFYMEIIH